MPHSLRLFSTYDFEEKIKFSAFLGKEKTYTLDRKKDLQSDFKAEHFTPKKEFTPQHQKFDPNIRQRPMEMENHMQWLYERGIKPKKPGLSSYAAIYSGGEVWHLFNAERMSLGRMAEKIAIYIRGKHKPTYSPEQSDIGDKCVVINASTLKLTGRKKEYKLYRHHTGYPGGLKEIPFRDLIQKNPKEIIYRTVKGMLPNNTIRDDILKNLIVHNGPYHNHLPQKLPYFTDVPPVDINKEIGFEEVLKNKDKLKVVYETHPNELPEEFKDVKRELDPQIGVPYQYVKKTEKWKRRNQKLAVGLRNSFRFLKKYRKM